MKILLTCDPEIPVPPIRYGGIERIVDGLALGYKNQGHEVYLIAHPDSKCKHTEQNFKWPALQSKGFLNIIKNSHYLYTVAKKIRPDIIHSFSRLMYLYPLFFTIKINTVQSYQRKINRNTISVASKIAGRKLRFTACANHMIKGLPYAEKFTPIFNFTDTEYFKPCTSASRTHLMFLGRIENIKGAREAIEAALHCNMDIIVAGNIRPGHEEYFENEIKPFLINPLVKYIGEVNDEEKNFYLQRSKALLFPVKWEEPFGIVLAEALACGTPVIAFDRGSVPEIIENAKNGFIVNSVPEMSNAICKLSQLQTEYIREDAVKRFSLKTITSQYLSLFQKHFLNS